jgi:divalent metal cation (Fe/Co/Zn/Cd) transporter
VSRNPSLSKQLFGYAILGFALSEAMALFALMVAFFILFSDGHHASSSPVVVYTHPAIPVDTDALGQMVMVGVLIGTSGVADATRWCGLATWGRTGSFQLHDGV